MQNSGESLQGGCKHQITTTGLSQSRNSPICLRQRLKRCFKLFKMSIFLEKQNSHSSLLQDACAGKLWSVTLPDGSGRAAVRREIASDNSCLFNAVGYVMERSRDSATALRHAV